MAATRGIVVEGQLPDEPTASVPCKWCGQPTPMVSTRECDFCYELRSRVDKRPDLVKAMLVEAEAHDKSKS